MSVTVEFESKEVLGEMGLLLIQVSQRQSSVVILLPGWGLIVVESTVGGRRVWMATAGVLFGFGGKPGQEGT
jgi:hypothetical protein